MFCQLIAMEITQAAVSALRLFPLESRDRRPSLETTQTCRSFMCCQSSVDPDETIYQEARRINIAILPKSLFRGEVSEKGFKKKINETYNENYDASTSLKFSKAYRMGHFYAQSSMPLIDKSETTAKEIPISDTSGSRPCWRTFRRIFKTRNCASDKL